ncbi:MAG: hypothetical protein IMZ52_01625 [Actinobacteria bacterium]|nr:hypothetical protein [Actinomycetota bacterium]MBE3114818.1 hypothetical protein [Actinomycetota bacterium]
MVNLKKKTPEELQDEFNALTRKRYQLILDVDKATKELMELAEKVYEASPEYVRIVCLNCGGKGILDTEEGKKVKCNVCNMKCYMWSKLFKEVVDDDKSSKL